MEKPNPDYDEKDFELKVTDVPWITSFYLAVEKTMVYSIAMLRAVETS